MSALSALTSALVARCGMTDAMAEAMLATCALMSDTADGGSGEKTAARARSLVSILLTAADRYGRP